MPVQAIFFDIGDTLVFDDPPLPQRLASAFRAIGLSVDEAKYPRAYRIGEAFAAAQYVRGIPWEDPDSLGKALRLILNALELPVPDLPDLLRRFAAVPFTRRVHPEALGLLAELQKRGFILGGISDWETTLPELLMKLGITPYFDALAVSEIVGAAKPDPRLFQEALRQAKVAPEHSLHIGDWFELDVAGAQAAGMSALLFDWAERRPNADCQRVVTFSQLASYLRSLPDPIQTT